jgi:hypothetical protein
MTRVAGRRIERAVAAAALFAALVTGASGQDWTAPRTTDRAARSWERSEDRSSAGWEAQAKKAAQVQKAREDEWDRKTKQVTRSICTGAKGC